jgi:putative hydrolase of the HAD superfamily
MAPLPKAILFDLDDTIISFGDRRLLFRVLAEEFAAEIAPIEPPALAEALNTRSDWFWGDQDRHRRWRFRLQAGRTELVRHALADLGLPERLAAPIGERFHRYREERVEFFPRAVETLEELRRRRVRLALVTNGAAEPQRAKLERFDLARLFDHVQIEGEAGFGKPEERAYRHALQSLAVEPHETWMVGDNLEWEVAAPQRLGIYAIWHDHLGHGLPPGSPIRPDRIVRTIAELLD